MDVQLQPAAIMNAQERTTTEAWAVEQNKKLSAQFERSADPNAQLGKDDFLRLLLTQLSNQDPTAPMEDREFIAQMAQFSSLEQMTNMASDFAKMAQMVKSSEATGALGRSVELYVGDEKIQGVVEAVTRDAMPQILVGGRLFNWDQVRTVYETTPAPSAVGEYTDEAADTAKEIESL
jgi:flagellar basal-body rod modification protein FlgD